MDLFESSIRQDYKGDSGMVDAVSLIADDLKLVKIKNNITGNMAKLNTKAEFDIDGKHECTIGVRFDDVPPSLATMTEFEDKGGNKTLKEFVRELAKLHVDGVGMLIGITYDDGFNKESVELSNDETINKFLSM